MSWVVEVIADSSGKWTRNGVFFATEAEAAAAARNLFERWTLVTEYRAAQSDEPVNYRWDTALPYPACLIEVPAAVQA